MADGIDYAPGPGAKLNIPGAKRSKPGLGADIDTSLAARNRAYGAKLNASASGMDGAISDMADKLHPAK